MPWEKKEKKQETYATVGACIIYKVKVQGESWSFQRLWMKGYPLQTGAIRWLEEDKTLIVGFDQGKIARLKPLGNSLHMQEVSAHEIPNHLVQVDEFQTHNLRVMGILSHPSYGGFVSISDAGTMKICESAKGTVVHQVDLSKLQGGKETALKQMIYLDQRKVIAVADALGNVHLHDATTTDLDVIKTLSIETGQQIRGLAANSHQNFIVAGSSDGAITVFDLFTPGKERNAKILVSFQGKENVRLVAWRETPRREIITADQGGIITVWDLKEQEPVFVLQAHSDAITQMQWFEEK